MTLFSWIDSCWFQVLKLFKYGLLVWVWLTSLVASLCPRYTEWIWGCEMFPSNSHADGAPTLSQDFRSCCKMLHTGQNGPLKWRNLMSSWQCGCLLSWKRLWKGFKANSTNLPSKYYNLEFLILVAASDEPAKLDFLRKKVKCLPRNPCSMAIRSKLPKSTRLLSDPEELRSVMPFDYHFLRRIIILIMYLRFGLFFVQREIHYLWGIFVGNLVQ